MLCYMSEEQAKLEILWTPMQVARYLGVVPQTVYRWLCTEKVINPEKVVRFAHQVRIPRSEIERIAGIKKEEIFNKS